MSGDGLSRLVEATVDAVVISLRWEWVETGRITRPEYFIDSELGDVLVTIVVEAEVAP